MEINQGVPQGTILGPLLFILYVNDMDSYIKNCKIIQYADDTCIYISGKNVNSLISTLAADIENITKFFGAHKLMINVGKTKFVLIRKKSRNSAVEKRTMKVDGNEIEQVKETKYLGVIIDNNLSFESQTKSVLKKWQLALGLSAISQNSSHSKQGYYSFIV